MSISMAFFTQSNTIRYLISKLNKARPVFYMVRVEIPAYLPTFLAGVVVSFKHFFSPNFVSPSLASVFASLSNPFIMAFLLAELSETIINKTLCYIKLFTAIQAISFFAGLTIFPHAFIRAALLLFFGIKSSQKQFSTNNTRLINFISFAFAVTLSGTVLILASTQVRAGNIKLDPALLADLPYTLLLAFCFAIVAAVFSTAFVNKRLSNVKLLTTMLTNTVDLLFRKAMFYIAVVTTIFTCTCLRSIYAVNFPAVQTYLFNHVISNIYAPLRLGALADGASVSSSPGHKYSPRKQQLHQHINHIIKLQVLKAS